VSQAALSRAACPILYHASIRSGAAHRVAGGIYVPQIRYHYREDKPVSKTGRLDRGIPGVAYKTVDCHPLIYGVNDSYLSTKPAGNHHRLAGLAPNISFRGHPDITVEPGW